MDAAQQLSDAIENFCDYRKCEDCILNADKGCTLKDAHWRLRKYIREN